MRAVTLASLLLTLLTGAPAAAGTPEGGEVPRVLILFSGSADGADEPYRDLARLHAVMLRNLLGRYDDIAVEVRPVASYRDGQADRYLRTFYLGSTYDAPIPDALLSDVVAGAAVTWANYGVWRLDRVPGGLAALGLEYVGLRGSGAGQGDPAVFSNVTYRDHVFRKHPAATEMVEVRAAGAQVEVHAWARDATGRRVPYALRSGRFWYLADLPLTYIHETDRYLVFADLLGPMLGRDVSCEPRAVVRVEDIDPLDDPEDLRRAFGVLAEEDVPFAVAVIPIHASNAAAREGRPEARVAWQERPEALAQLRRVPELGGRPFQHGTTHQYEGLDNPEGRSGVDWEFWDVGAGGPIASLPVESALGRVRRGKATLQGLGIEPVGWVTPHYAFDPAMGPGLTAIYPVAFERRQYGVGDAVAGQFFPFPVRDTFGARIIPENGGSIQPDRSASDLLGAARASRALRCPWFGFFFHPEVLDPAFEGPHALGADGLRGLIREVRAMGYRFVDPLEAVGGR